MPSSTSSIVVLGSDGTPTTGVIERLAARGHRTSHALRHADATRLLRERAAELLVVTPPLEDASPAEVIQRVHAVDASLPIVFAGSSQHIRPDELMGEGAFECVLDPLEHPDRLLSAVGYALGSREEDRELRYLRAREGGGLDSLVGEDASMRAVFDFARRVCARTAYGASPPILLTGETGTGKGAVAKAIHDLGVRRNRPFLAVNCAAIPANLVESELFGYERGAFTDASRSKPGLFETAHRGTLFLDELPSLPLDLQAKLLTAIEDRAIRRIGGITPIEVDVQLITAAQPVLSRMVKDGSFRRDLYHRLNVLEVMLPPLRDRGDDRLRLAERFVEEMSRRYGMEAPALSASAIQFIKMYHWPGNVRELRNQIERIVLLSEDRRAIEGWQFKRATGEFLRIEPEADAADGASFRVALPPGGLDLTDLEREVIKRALQQHDGNVSQTARYLSISRQTLIYRIKKHGLQND